MSLGRSGDLDNSQSHESNLGCPKHLFPPRPRECAVRLFTSTPGHRLISPLPGRSPQPHFIISRPCAETARCCSSQLQLRRPSFHLSLLLPKPRRRYLQTPQQPPDSLPTAAPAQPEKANRRHARPASPAPLICPPVATTRQLEGTLRPTAPPMPADADAHCHLHYIGSSVP